MPEGKTVGKKSSGHGRGKKTPKRAPKDLSKFKLPCRRESQVNAVLALSMPVRAKYPHAWIRVIEALPEEQRVVMAADKTKVTDVVLGHCRKQARRHWSSLVDAGKADAVARGNSDNSDDEAEEVLRQRWTWMNAQLEKLPRHRWFAFGRKGTK